NEDKNNSDKVTLMTVHAAKGLEFPYVYIVGLEENLFPSMQSLNTREDLEEERRLFYVALTRAEKRATLSYAESRYRWGNLLMSEGSRFIEEINPEFLNNLQSRSPGGYGTTTTLRRQATQQKSSYKKLNSQEATVSSNTSSQAMPVNAEEIQPGVQVSHQRFGNGKVLQVEGNGANKKATIFFRQAGQKHLLLKFARLKVIKS
ncbi:MAG: 3'-5' exonuclease, partial [Bacteroidota bacterium]